MPARRLALYLPTLRFGGVERVALNLASGFLARGAAVDLVAADAAGELASQIPASARLIDLRSRRVLTSLPGLARYLRRECPDAVIGMMEHCSVVALVARRLAGSRAKVVTTSHTNLSQTLALARRIRERALPSVMRWLFPSADAVVAVSDGVAADLERHVPGVRPITIYNPVLSLDFRILADEPFDHPWFGSAAPPVILGVGRLVAQKDFETLLRSFAMVRAQRPVRLLVLGEGPDRQRLEALAHELGVEQEVSLPGYVKNVYPFMKRAAVFVLASRWEGFGLVLVEALASGTKVISTESGPREILQNGRLGELVSPGDAEKMARAILQALDSPPRPVPPEALLPYTTEAATARYAALLGPEW